MNNAMKEDIMCQVCMQQDGMPGSKFCKPNLEVREIDIDKCPIRIEIARRFLEVLKLAKGEGNVRDQTQEN